jgi:hypothetical protein
VGGVILAFNLIFLLAWSAWLVYRLRKGAGVGGAAGFTATVIALSGIALWASNGGVWIAQADSPDLASFFMTGDTTSGNISINGTSFAPTAASTLSNTTSLLTDSATQKLLTGELVTRDYSVIVLSVFASFGAAGWPVACTHGIADLASGFLVVLLAAVNLVVASQYANSPDFASKLDSGFRRDCTVCGWYSGPSALASILLSLAGLTAFVRWGFRMRSLSGAERVASAAFFIPVWIGLIAPFIVQCSMCTWGCFNFLGLSGGEMARRVGISLGAGFHIPVAIGYAAILGALLRGGGKLGNLSTTDMGMVNEGGAAAAPSKGSPSSSPPKSFGAAAPTAPTAPSSAAAAAGIDFNSNKSWE